MMTKKQIIVYGIFPPPFHGQSIGTQMVYSYLLEKQKVIKVNLSPGSLNSGKYGYLFAYIIAYINSLIKMRAVKGKKNTLYFVPAVRPLSHLKDIILLLLFHRKFDRVICHIRSGEFDNLFRNKLSIITARYLIKRVTCFVFLSEGLAEKCKNYIPEEKRKVIYNFIDQAITISNDDARRLIMKKEKQNCFNYAFISNFIEEKGYKTLLKAFDRISTLNNDVKLYLIGDGSKEAVKELENINRINKQVIFYGKISDRNELKDVLEKIHVFVLPTFYKTEAQPRSIIEALNFGIPVISTFHASIPEIITHNFNGKLVPIKDEITLSKAMEEVLDKVEWKKTALNARKSYDENHDFEKLAKELMNLMI